MINAATLRKRRSRAKLGQRIELPLPPGTAEALARICHAGSFEDQREAISTMIHRIDALLQQHPEAVRLLSHPVSAGDLSHYLERLA